MVPTWFPPPPPPPSCPPPHLLPPVPLPHHFLPCIYDTLTSFQGFGLGFNWLVVHSCDPVSIALHNHKLSLMSSLVLPQSERVWCQCTYCCHQRKYLVYNMNTYIITSKVQIESKHLYSAIFFPVETQLLVTYLLYIWSLN